MSRTATDAKFIPLRIAVITISDSRTADNDTSGDYLAESLLAEDHRLAARKIVRDDRYVLRAEISTLIADQEIDVIHHRQHRVDRSRCRARGAGAAVRQGHRWLRRIVPRRFRSRYRGCDDPVPGLCRPGQRHHHLLHARLARRLPHGLA